MDEVMWKQDRFDEIKAKLLPFLASCGYEDEVIFCPVSGLKGDNVLTKTEAKSWWQGDSLIETLDKIEL
jgi:translation elongation factor EF-1alpha